MTITFDETYFNSSQGYINYYNYPHFKLRAQWLYDIYVARGYTGKIYIIGVGYGYIIKELLDIVPVQAHNKIVGIEFSQYAYDQAVALGVGDNVVLIDAKDMTYPNDLDIVVSWNVLDCIPNDTVATAICNLLSDKAVEQLHVLCTDDTDHNADSYKTEGYYIQTRAYWAGKFVNVDPATQKIIMVEFNTGDNWRKTVSGWEKFTGLNVPLTKLRVSN